MSNVRSGCGAQSALIHASEKNQPLFVLSSRRHNSINNFGLNLLQIDRHEFEFGHFLDGVADAFVVKNGDVLRNT